MHTQTVIANCRNKHGNNQGNMVNVAQSRYGRNQRFRNQIEDPRNLSQWNWQDFRDWLANHR